MVIVLGCHGVDKAKPEDEYLNVPIPTFSHELWVMTERDHGWLKLVFSTEFPG